MCAAVLPLRFHKEACEMLSVPVPCGAAALAAGRAQAERGGAVGQAQAELRGEQESSGPRAEARREPLGGCRAHPGKRDRDRAGAVMRQGQYSWQRNWSAGCSTWLFKFDLISLRSFFHLMLCKNWFYLPLIFFFLPPSPPVDE